MSVDKEYKIFWKLEDDTPIRCGLDEWAEFMENGERVIDRTSIDEDVEVSTVFLGLDHSWNLLTNHEAVLFETMVFGGENHQCMKRYTSIKDARRGHDEWVIMIRAGEKI